MPSHATQPSDRAAESRSRILDAALKEFSSHGLAGARTDRIASLAGVNKALLYYYFESKEKLYLAALEMIAERIRDTTMDVFLREATAGERLMRAALNHFDRVLTQNEFQSLMQQEMMRMHKGESGAMHILVKRVFTPLITMYQAMVREGIESGELIEADWMQLYFATLGANVFYFLSAPIMRLAISADPYAPEAIAGRRASIVEYLGKALFNDRKAGARLAAKVLQDMPMPEVNWEKVGVWRKNERAE